MGCQQATSVRQSIMIVPGLLRISAAPRIPGHIRLACAQERDPQRLLRPLAKLLQERGVSVEHAVFVPPDSSYSSLGPRSEEPDLSWQQAMQHVWDSQLGPGMTQVPVALLHSQ